MGQIIVAQQEKSQREASVLLFASRGRALTWAKVLRTILLADFIADEVHPFRGHFGARASVSETLRWQSKGGEKVGDVSVPKLPYYYTYWGYRAAELVAASGIEQIRPITAKAINDHFGKAQWLRVVRDYSFAKGPLMQAPLAETVRHTVRAADLLRLLRVEPRIISSVAWNLVRESSQLQASDGAWLEFRGDKDSSSLWSTVYVFCFLSGLLQPDEAGSPSERVKFVQEAKKLVQSTEEFLIAHWKRHRWTFDSSMPWQEGAIAVVSEVAEYFTNKATLRNCFVALRGLVTPGGNMTHDAISIGTGAATEDLQALRLAFAMRAAGGSEALTDSRYQLLVEWIVENLDLHALRTYDIAFLARIVDLEAIIPVHQGRR